MTAAATVPWWERWPGRLEVELARFAERGLPCDAELPAAGHRRLVVRTAVELDGSSAEILVVYPDGYPDRRFAVFAPAVRLSRHQAPGGNLCVFPRDSRHWRPSTLAADVVADKVPELVRLVTTGGEELRAREDPQGEPWTSYYAYLPTGAVIVDDSGLSLPGDARGGSLRLAFDHRGTRWLVDALSEGPFDAGAAADGQALLVTVEFGGERGANADQALAAKYTGPVLHGRWARVDEPPWDTDPAALWAAAAAATPPPGPDGLQALGVVLREEVRLDEWEDSWVFLVRRTLAAPGQRPPRKRKGPTPPRRTIGSAGPVLVRALRWTEEDLAVRIPELAGMRGKDIALFGLGSLGAPLAQEFAKAGIGSMTLVDHDFMDPATSVRHPLGLEMAGVSKPLAVSRALAAQHPRTACTPQPLYVGEAGLDEPDEPEGEVLARVLHRASLVAVALAEREPSRQLDRFAAERGLPRLHVWSVSGFGGVVALLRPGATGCYHCLELFQRVQADRGDPLVAVPDDADERLIQGRGCADRTFQASHADLMPLVAQAARVAFGSLCGPEGGYPLAPHDVFSVQLRDPAGAQLPPRWRGWALPPYSDCLCSG